MTLPVDTLLVILIISSFLVLGTTHLPTAIRLSAAQGICIGLLPLATAHADFSLRVILLGLAIITLKGFVFPLLLRRAMRESMTSTEMQPFVGSSLSILAGLFALMAAFWLDSRMDFLPSKAHQLFPPVAFFVMITGLFLIVARKLAVTQVVGYLQLENGIYIFGLAIAAEVPVVVELGVLLDVFVAVFVMGIAIFRINREFNHMDSERLRQLKG